MPKKNKHKLGNNQTIYHRDIHNGYGLLMSMATNKGLMNRDRF